MKAILTQESFLIPTIIIQRDSRLFYNLIKDVPCRLKKYSVCRWEGYCCYVCFLYVLN